MPKLKPLLKIMVVTSTTSKQLLGDGVAKLHREMSSKMLGEMELHRSNGPLLVLTMTIMIGEIHLHDLRGLTMTTEVIEVVVEEVEVAEVEHLEEVTGLVTSVTKKAIWQRSALMVIACREMPEGAEEVEEVNATNVMSRVTLRESVPVLMQMIEDVVEEEEVSVAVAAVVEEPAIIVIRKVISQGSVLIRVRTETADLTKGREEKMAALQEERTMTIIVVVVVAAGMLAQVPLVSHGMIIFLRLHKKVVLLLLQDKRTVLGVEGK